MARKPKEGQRGIVTEREVDEWGYTLDVVQEEAVYSNGWWWVDGIAVTAKGWRPLTITERFARWLRRK